MVFRIGINVGDVIEEDNRVYGDGINVASRIEGLADAGGICISSSAYEQIRSKLSLDYEDIGEHSVKNISWPVRVYRIPIESRGATASNTVGVPLSKQPSIVVVPFANLSPDPEQEYFSDGLTDEIITDLTQVKKLLVISTGTAMTFKGTKKKISEIAKEVSARYVLEGSVRRAANDLRISAQLIDATNDTLIWAEKYNGTLDDVFDIQEKVSRSIVGSLKLELSTEESKKIAERPIDDVHAYEYYYRAKREINRGSEDGLKRAHRELQSGLEILGDNILLNKGMAEVHLYYYELGLRAGAKALSNIEEYVTKINELQPDSDDTLYLLGRLERFRGSSSRATKYFKKAFDINPDNTDVLLFLGHAYGAIVGRTTLAEPIFDRLLKLDPLTPINYGILGIVQMFGGLLENALSNLQKMAILAQDNTWLNMCSVYIYAWQGQYDRAYKVVDQVAEQKAIHSAWYQFFKYALQGKKSEAMGILTKNAKNYFWNDPDLWWFGICNYALIEEKEEALNWLEHGIDRGFINYPFLNKHIPFTENIRGEERFKKLMERVKYEWENFKAE